MRHGNSNVDMSSESAAKANRKRRDKLRAAGLRPMQVWVKKSQRAAVRDFVAKLLIGKRRAKAEPVEDDDGAEE